MMIEKESGGNKTCDQVVVCYDYRRERKRQTRSVGREQYNQLSQASTPKSDSEAIKLEFVTLVEEKRKEEK